MRLLGAILGVMAAAVVLISGQSTSAEPVALIQQLEVKGRVLPYHTLIVDENGVLIRILSNTEENDAALRVFLGNVAAKNRLPLAEKTYSQYRQLVPEGFSRIGVLYECGASRPLRSPIDNEALPKSTWSPLGLIVMPHHLAAL
jgi:hypothetical protein